MKQLKIKDNVDLKELEKYLTKLNIMNGDICIETNVYCLINESNKNFIENNCINDYFVECYFNDEKQIDFCSYPEEINWELVINLVYILTKADLVEVVDE